MGYRVVVVGATGNVGREMLAVLAEREFPIDELAAVASSRSQGSEVEFGETGREIKVQNLEHFDFTGWDMALFAAGSGPTKIHAPRAAAAGCVVIDNTSYWRMDPDVPLVVPDGLAVKVAVPTWLFRPYQTTELAAGSAVKVKLSGRVTLCPRFRIPVTPKSRCSAFTEK